MRDVIVLCEEEVVEPSPSVNREKNVIVIDVEEAEGDHKDTVAVERKAKRLKPDIWAGAPADRPGNVSDDDRRGEERGKEVSKGSPSGLDLRNTVDVVWEFKDGEQWRLFDSAAAAAVEAALHHCRPAAQSAFVNARTKEEVVYRYDLARMLQTNMKTSWARCIRRRPPPPTPTWQFEESGEWHTCDTTGAAAAEAALQASPPRHTVQSVFVNPKTKQATKYDFDLRAGVQRNTVSRYERRIRRLPPYDPAVFALGDIEDAELAEAPGDQSDSALEEDGDEIYCTSTMASSKRTASAQAAAASRRQEEGYKVSDDERRGEEGGKQVECRAGMTREVGRGGKIVHKGAEGGRTLRAVEEEVVVIIEEEEEDNDRPHEHEDEMVISEEEEDIFAARAPAASRVSAPSAHAKAVAAVAAEAAAVAGGAAATAEASRRVQQQQATLEQHHVDVHLEAGVPCGKLYPDLRAAFARRLWDRALTLRFAADHKSSLDSTVRALVGTQSAVNLLCWYKSTNTDADGAARSRRPSPAPAPFRRRCAESRGILFLSRSLSLYI
jgi:hypothetical protein